MIVFETVLTALAATTMMTVFSYVLSYIVKVNFKEPEHLSVMLKRIPIHDRVAGWAMHYFVGLLFVVAYFLMWKNGIEANTGSGLAIGAISGLMAILVWHLTLRLHPHPPRIHRIPFYIQLVPAHIVFAIAATWIYQVL